MTQMHVELWEALPWPDMRLIPVTTFIYHIYTEFIYKYKHYKVFYRKLYLEFWTKGQQKMKISYRTHLWNNFPSCISGSVWMWVYVCLCACTCVYFCITFWFAFAFSVQSSASQNLYWKLSLCKVFGYKG